MLAASFGTYGLLKKTAPLPPLEGLALETVLLGLPAAAYLVAAERGGTGVFLHTATATSVFLIGGGLVTIVPLLLFASAVRVVPLSTMGLLQFISPTIQLVLALAIYREPFGRSRVAGFVAVWLALVVFAIDQVRTAWAGAVLRREREPAPGVASMPLAAFLDSANGLLGFQVQVLSSRLK